MADNKIMPVMGIKVDDGRRRVPITNIYGDEVGVFYFNPTDTKIINRYNEFTKSLDYVFEPFESLSDSGDENNSDVENALSEAESRLNEAVNKLFGGDAAGAFFGSIPPFSATEGVFYFEKVMQSVGEYISAQFDAETNKINTRIEKYTKKYKRK